MTEFHDVRTAIARYLKEQVLRVEGRVFRPEVPKAEEGNMPRGCIVVFSGGGGHMQGRDRMEIFDSLLDIACYGETRLEAEEVGDEAMYALRELSHLTSEGVYLHWARIAGGVKSAIDNDTTWPFSIITVQVLHSLP